MNKDMCVYAFNEKLYRQHKVYLANTICKINQDGFIPVQIVNPNNYDIELYFHTKLGILKVNNAIICTNQTVGKSPHNVNKD